MSLILLFFNLISLCLVDSFYNRMVSQNHPLIRSKNVNIVAVFGADSTISNDENIYFNSSTKSSEVNPRSLTFINSENLRRMRKSYGGGIDQRELEKTCLEKIYDKVQEQVMLNKLRKYNYQMKLLRKLQNNEVNMLEKIKAIDEYNYFMESSKYISNLENGGLYKNWTNNDF